MTLQKRIIRLSPHTVVVFVAVIGIGLVAAVLLFTVLIPVLGGNSFDEPSPLFSVSEFPSTDETDDSAVMQLAAELLSSPQWTEGAVSLEDWNLTDNGPLTRGGLNSLRGVVLVFTLTSGSSRNLYSSDAWTSRLLMRRMTPLVMQLAAIVLSSMD